MRKLVTLLTCTALLATPFVASAQTPDDIADIVGARGSSFESLMQDRGYSFVKKVGVAQFWWNGNSKKCVSAAFDNGRVSSIQSTASGDCGHSGGGSTAAGIVAGAAAVGLIAALSSHHKKNPARDTEDYNQVYQQGYNDAMYGGQYNRSDSEAYHSGYLAGEAERNNRRHANSALVRGAPAAAQNACKMRGDQAWGIPDGSTVPVSAFDYGQGNYEITVASGHHRRANCSVNARGVISDFLPQ